MMKKILLLFCLVFGLSFVPTAQAAMISEKQEIEMGERAGKALEAQYGLYQDDEVASRIDRIGKALAARRGRFPIPSKSSIHRTSMLLLVPAASSMSIRALWIP